MGHVLVLVQSPLPSRPVVGDRTHRRVPPSGRARALVAALGQGTVKNVTLVDVVQEGTIRPRVGRVTVTGTPDRTTRIIPGEAVEMIFAAAGVGVVNAHPTVGNVVTLLRGLVVIGSQKGARVAAPRQRTP